MPSARAVATLDMAKPGTDSFLDLVRRSCLVEPDQLDRLLAQLNQQEPEKVSDPEFVCDHLIEAGLLTRWQCDRLREGRYKGFFLKKYKLLDHIGSGGMSHVYLAEHVLMRRRVAIKVLPKQRVKDTSYLSRFQREALAAAALDHPNIVRAYDIDNDGQNHFFVMEYIEGQDLQALVRSKGPLDYAVAADYIRQAANGLEHAHSAGLIHRDIKPANLLVDKANVVKVLDLGLARFSEDDHASLTLKYDETVLGTADYLAPEQARDSHGVDARADVYGLGCSLYFLLTGHPPFTEGTLPQRLMQHQNAPPPSIYKDRPDAPEDLVAICLKMMAKKPADRQQTAAEVAQDLVGWLHAHGIHVESSISGPGSSAKLAVGAPRTSSTSDSGTARKAAPVARTSYDPSSSSLLRARPLTDDSPSDSSKRATARSPQPRTGPAAPGALPIAQPLDQHASAQPATQEEQELELPDTLLQADWTVLSQLCAGPTVEHPQPALGHQALQRQPSKKNDLSLLWLSIGAGIFLAFAILILVFMAIR